MKYLIIRMLGNDLPGLHSFYQTYNNLEFTIMNESNFENTEKLYVLNRIVDIEKKNRVKHPSPYKQKDQQCDDKFPFPPSGFVMIL